MSILQDKPLLLAGAVAGVSVGALLWATRRCRRVLTITVPATTANLACGFDAFGAAFELRMTLRAEPAGQSATSTRFEYSGEGSEGVCTDEGNLIWKSALACVKMHAPDRVLPKLVIKVQNDVPFGRGLGSSATAIIAGMVRIRPLTQILH
jgi:homoserine kinase